MKYSKIKIENILKAKISLFFLAIGILVKRPNRIEINLLIKYIKNAISTTIIAARISVSKIDSIFHHPHFLILHLEHIVGIFPNLYKFYQGTK
jgi:hypothetical protein